MESPGPADTAEALRDELLAETRRQRRSPLLVPEQTRYRLAIQIGVRTQNEPSDLGDRLGRLRGPVVRPHAGRGEIVPTRRQFAFGNERLSAWVCDLVGLLAKSSTQRRRCPFSMIKNPVSNKRHPDLNVGCPIRNARLRQAMVAKPSVCSMNSVRPTTEHAFAHPRFRLRQCCSATGQPTR